MRKTLGNLAWCAVGVYVGLFGLFGMALFYLEMTSSESPGLILFALLPWVAAIGFLFGVAAVVYGPLRPILAGVALWTTLVIVYDWLDGDDWQSYADQLSIWSPAVWLAGAFISAVVASKWPRR